MYIIGSLGSASYDTTRLQGLGILSEKTESRRPYLWIMRPEVLASLSSQLKLAVIVIVYCDCDDVPEEVGQCPIIPRPDSLSAFDARKSD